MTNNALYTKRLKKDWLSNKVSYRFPHEQIRENHKQVEEIIKTSDKIKKIEQISIGNLLLFHIDDYLNALEYFSKVLCMDNISNPKELERCFVKFLDITTETENENNDIYYQPRIEDRKKIGALFEKIIKSSETEPQPLLLRFGIRRFIEIISIQPCTNGNHRAADFILNLILIKNGLPFFALTPDNVEKYYALFNTPSLRNNKVDIQKMINFIAKETKKNVDHVGSTY